MSAIPEPAACPKCGRARTDGSDTCARCGLMFSRWTPEKQPGTANALDEKGSMLWSELSHSWTDESKHEAFLKYCSAAGALPSAGRLYRGRLDMDPNDVLAAKMQARIVGMASALMTPSQPAGASVSRKTWFWWVIIAGAIGGVLASLLVKVLRP
jgi:hypothetical protein